MLELRHATPPEWAQVALASFDAFLQDHAANERKVSQSALRLAVEHPDRPELVDAMVAISQEELSHFALVWKLLRDRGLGLGRDAPDPYMRDLRAAIKNADVEVYLRDRLILFGIIEARGCERFALIAEALEPGPLKDLYVDLVRSEARHHQLYHDLARRYFDAAEVDARTDELLDLEASVARALPLRPALH